MKLYEIYDRDTGLGFSKFDNMKGLGTCMEG